MALTKPAIVKMNSIFSRAFEHGSPMPIQLYQDLNNIQRVFSEDELRQKNRIAQNICYALNAVSFCLSVCGLLISYWFSNAVVTLMLCPLIMILALYKLESMTNFIYDYWEFKHFDFTVEFSFGNYKRSEHPTLLVGIILPTITLAIGLFTKYQLVSALCYWLPLLPLFAVIGLVLFEIGHGKVDKLKILPKHLIGLCLFTLFYSYNSIIVTNCFYDYHAPVVYNVKVTGRYSPSGRSGSNFYITVDSFGPVKQNQQLNVNKLYFFTTAKHDTIPVYYQKGSLQLGWFAIMPSGSVEIQE